MSETGLVTPFDNGSTIGSNGWEAEVEGMPAYGTCRQAARNCNYSPLNGYIEMVLSL
ncbi:hypothetical protein [Bradyrhizobium sp. AS23.2]|uniref:hypothetical protein n=1 Tax=Bradyrhizobium sp. AS23.2 TaxID=1680155 RepID=UPI001430E7F8|nr:hypothetical protein [Bradyrhizobium sp. AS23.2]